jgi:hypothetical protein
MGVIALLVIFAQLYTKRHPEVPSYAPPTAVPKVDVHVGGSKK